LPLSQVAVQVREAAAPFQVRTNDSFVFPSKPGKPLSDMTLTKVLRDMGHAQITVHGFRSSFRDWAAEQTATPGDVVEAAYRRTNYLDKRRVLMDEWCRFATARWDAGSKAPNTSPRPVDERQPPPERRLHGSRGQQFCSAEGNRHHTMTSTEQPSRIPARCRAH
jgi:hypothetical protein